MTVSELDAAPAGRTAPTGRGWKPNLPEEWRDAVRSPLFIAGAVIVGVLTLVAAFAPFLAPYDPRAESDALLETPSLEHLLGTNVRGQDILSQVIYGARTSLPTAVAGATLAVVLGAVVGVGAGVRGGGVDLAAMRLVDLLLALPGIPLLILIATLAGPSRLVVIFIVATAAAPPIARVLRSQTLTLRERGFVHAARGFGAGPLYLLRRHLAPAMGPLIVTWWLDSVTLAIGLESGLAFLGLAEPGQITWGGMLDEAFSMPGLLFGDAWPWLVLPPGLAITFALLGFTFIGVGLEPVFNPRWGRTQ